jgi:autotransporter-associated beta strand protein
VTLTNNRTAAALRSTGTTPTLALAGFILKTNGILAGNGPLTVSGTGALTATGITGGNIYLTAGNNAISISSDINDNGGAVTVVKNGASNLTLSSITSNYSGGTVVNAGTLTWTANTNLGLAGSRNITVNGTATLAGFDGTSLNALTVGSGGVATLSGLISYTFTSLSGAGTLIAQAGQNKLVSLGNASSFTGNLALIWLGFSSGFIYAHKVFIPPVKVHTMKHLPQRARHMANGFGYVHLRCDAVGFDVGTERFRHGLQHLQHGLASARGLGLFRRWCAHFAKSTMASAEGSGFNHTSRCRRGRS